MDLLTIDLDGFTLAYRESRGTGHPIVLVHGNSGSSTAFSAQVDGTLGEDHRVVAIDLPGHGGSDRFDDIASYGMPGYADVLVRAARALGVADAMFAGWSLGGHIVLEAASHLPDAVGFMIFGTPPLDFPPRMEEAFLPHPAMAAATGGELDAELAAAFAESFFAPGFVIDLAPVIAEVMETDPDAREGLGASLHPDGYADEVEIVATLDRPLAVLHGRREQLVSGDYIAALEMPTLWRDEIQYLDTGHTPQMEDPNGFSDLVAAFTADITD